MTPFLLKIIRAKQENSKIPLFWDRDLIHVCQFRLSDLTPVESGRSERLGELAHKMPDWWEGNQYLYLYKYFLYLYKYLLYLYNFFWYLYKHLLYLNKYLPLRLTSPTKCLTGKISEFVFVNFIYIHMCIAYS